MTLLLTQALILKLEYFKRNFHVYKGKLDFSVLFIMYSISSLQFGAKLYKVTDNESSF